MNRGQIFEELTAVFHDVFDDEDISINESTTAADIEEGLKNVGEMIDLIGKLLR